MFDMPKTGTWEERGGWVVRALAAEFGWTLAQAAGLVGNLGFESEGFKTMQERGVLPPRGGWGWAQWTGPRRRAFEAYAMAQHLAPASDEANYGYLVKELRESFPAMIAQLKGATTVEQAAWLVGQEFERPGGTTPDNLPGYQDRVRWGTRALNGARPDPTAAPAKPPALDEGEEWDVIEEGVRLLQVALSKEGFYPKDKIDGDPGPATVVALQQWRRSYFG